MAWFIVLNIVMHRIDTAFVTSMDREYRDRYSPNLPFIAS